MKQRVAIWIALTLSILGLCTIARAQGHTVNVTGLWIMTNPSPAGMEIATLELAQSGPHVTGTLTPADGNRIPLDNVTVNNDQIAFRITRKEGHSKVEVRYKGAVHGDTMVGTFQQDNHSVEWKAKRSLYSGG